jgi:hypothetical protein
MWKSKEAKKKESHEIERALRDGYFDFGRDRDGMDLKTLFWDRIGRDGIFLGIVSGFFGMTK